MTPVNKIVGGSICDTRTCFPSIPARPGEWLHPDSWKGKSGNVWAYTVYMYISHSRIIMPETHVLGLEQRKLASCRDRFRLTVSGCLD